MIGQYESGSCSAAEGIHVQARNPPHPDNETKLIASSKSVRGFEKFRSRETFCRPFLLCFLLVPSQGRHSLRAACPWLLYFARSAVNPTKLATRKRSFSFKMCAWRQPLVDCR